MSEQQADAELQRLHPTEGPFRRPRSIEDLSEDEADKELLTRIAFADEPEDGPSVEDCLWAFKRQRLTREGRAVRRRIGAKLKTEPMPAAAEAALAAEDTTADAPGAPNPQDDPDDVDAQLMRLQQLARQRDALM